MITAAEAATGRFWQYVDKSDGCWNWIGTTAGPGRYGYFHVGGSRSNRQRVYAHRYSYELHVGPIPEGLEIDHLCRNTANHRRRRVANTVT
jgi:hypothetical protein